MIKKKKKNKILILGAGNFQVRGIKTARKLGYYVITVDNNPKNPGHKFGHQFINCDYTDFKKIYEIVVKNKVNHITTFASDFALYTVFRIQKKLLGEKMKCDYTKMILKNRFRTFQKKNQLNFPQFKLIKNSSLTNLPLNIKTKSKIICKPVLSSGSKGIKILEKKKINDYKKNIQENVNYKDEFIVEEYLSGVEYGGDAIINNNEIQFIAITKKYKIGANIIGHRFPIRIERTKKDLICDEIIKTCKILKFNNGVVNFDIILSNNKVFIIEMSPRTGGNGISELIEFSTSFNIEEYLLNLKIKKHLKFNVNYAGKKYASLLIGSNKDGNITNLSPISYLKKSVPEIKVVKFFKNKNSFIKKFTDSDGIVCMIIFECMNENDFFSKRKKIINYLDLQVK